MGVWYASAVSAKARKRVRAPSADRLEGEAPSTSRRRSLSKQHTSPRLSLAVFCSSPCGVTPAEECALQVDVTDAVKKVRALGWVPTIQYLLWLVRARDQFGEELMSTEQTPQESGLLSWMAPMLTSRMLIVHGL